MNKKKRNKTKNKYKEKKETATTTTYYTCKTMTFIYELHWPFCHFIVCKRDATARTRASKSKREREREKMIFRRVLFYYYLHRRYNFVSVFVQRETKHQRF